MRRVILPILIVLLVGGLAGCSGCGKKPVKVAAPPLSPFADGFPSVDALIAAYQETIEKKDPELLKRLLLTPDDMGKLKQGSARQIWNAYFMISKRAFMDKNRDLLGKKLELVDFKLGPPVGQPGGQIHVYRSTIIRFKLPDGKIVESEINFLVEVAGTWKIFGLKYLKDEMKRRGILEGLGIQGTPKFHGVDTVHDFNIKVKRRTPTPAPQPAPGASGGGQ